MSFSYKGITYRAATKDDLVAISCFLPQILEHNALFDIIPSEDLTLGVEELKTLFEKGNGTALLALKNDTIVGAVILAINTIWFTKDFDFLTNLAFYVAPEYRKGGYRVQQHLLEAIKLFSREAKMPVLIDILDASGNVDKVSRFLSMKGFKNIGLKALFKP